MLKRISDYRDYQIAHPLSPDAMRGTLNPFNDPYGYIAGWGAKNPSSETPVALMPGLRGYLQRWIQYVDENATRSKWRKDSQ